MKKMNFSALGVVIVSGAMVLSACGGSSSSTEATSAPVESAAAPAESAAAPAEEMVIGVSFDKMIAFREGEKAAIEAAAKELGVTLDFQVAEEDAQRQSSQIEAMIANGAKGIVSIPWDIEAVKADIDAAGAAGVPFVTFDQAPSDPSWVSFHVGGDPYADGAAAGKFYCETAGGKDFTLLEFQGGLNNDNGINRSKGLNDVIAKDCPNVKIVAQIPTEWKPEPALAGTENTLAKYPALDGIYSPTDGLLPAIFSALDKVGRNVKVGEDGHVVIVSIDGDSGACKALREGLIDLDLVTPLPQMTKDALAAAVDQANGKAAPSPALKKIAGLEVTPANLAENEASVWGCSGA